MEAPPVQQKTEVSKTPPHHQDAPSSVKKKDANGPPHRVNLWFTDSLYQSLVAEAATQGMTLGAWVQTALLKRPERVVEKVFLPSGTKAKLDRIPVLENELEALRTKLSAPRHIACPNCGVDFKVDLADEVHRAPAKSKR